MDKGSNGDSKIVIKLWLLLGALLILPVVEAVRIALGYTNDLRYFPNRIAFLSGAFLLAILYATLREEEDLKRLSAEWRLESR